MQQFVLSLKSKSGVANEIKKIKSLIDAAPQNYKDCKRKKYNLPYLLLLYRANVNAHFTEFELQTYPPDFICSTIARAIWQNNQNFILDFKDIEKQKKYLRFCIRKILDIGFKTMQKISQH